MYKKYLYKKRQTRVKLPFGSLQRALLFFVVMPLLLITAAVLHFMLQQANDFQQKRLKNDLELIGRAISIPVGNALNQNDKNAVNSALDSVFIISEVYGASVFDMNGKLIAAAGLTNNDLSHSKIPVRIKETGVGEEKFSRIQGQRLFSHFLPLFDQHDQIQGLIQISRKASDFEYSLKRLISVAWSLWALLSLLIVIAVFIGHYGAIGRYVEKLLFNMQKVSEGNFKHRFALKGPKELALLTQGLNSMLDSIGLAHKQIERQQLEQQTLLSQLKEQEKIVEMGRMSQGIAHELAAPLSVIDGRASRIERTTVDQQILKQAAVIREQSQRLTNIIRQLLDYSRPDLQQAQNIYLFCFLETIAKDLHEEFEQYACLLKLNRIPNNARITADTQRLKLAINNLLRNALQAGSSEIIMTVEHIDGYCVIKIQDNGKGLPTNDIEQLTDAFFTTKLPGQGTGLGLAIVKAVMQESDAQLILQNRQPKGCEVQLIFPVKE